MQADRKSDEGIQLPLSEPNRFMHSHAFSCARTPEVERETEGEIKGGGSRVRGERRWEREKRMRRGGND